MRSSRRVVILLIYLFLRLREEERLGMLSIGIRSWKIKATVYRNKRNFRYADASGGISWRL